MKTRAWMSVTTLTVLLSAGITNALAAKPGGTTACPILPTTDFAVYGETFKGGVGTSSRSWMAHFFDWWKTQDSSVDYQFLTAAQAQACTNLKGLKYPDLKMWVQPGGNAYDQQVALGATGKANINEFIVNQGAYLGVCAGAYYAAPNYWWEGKYYAHPNLLGAYPVTLEGAIGSIAPWPGYAMTALSNGRNAIYYGGPTVGLLHTNPSTLLGEKAASFASIDGQLPAVIVYNKLLLTSVHLEAFENDGISGLSTADRTENYKYLANLINSVTKAGFRVPPYADNLPACSDQADNDGDGKVDLLDPGCSSALDTDETDVPSAQVIAEGFENGLGTWTVTGTGAPWAASSLDPYTGSRHAYAAQPGVSTMTYLERTLSLNAFTNGGKLIYYRRLIGLDGADEFVAQYYDMSWHTLEATGSASANDAAYVQREFLLPRAATKLRFGCMAGAVSEKCELDDVSLFGQ